MRYWEFVDLDDEYDFYHLDDRVMAFYYAHQALNKNKPKIIHTPEYKPAERRFPNFRNLKKEDLVICVTNGIMAFHMGISSSKDNMTLRVRGIGETLIPDEVRKKIVEDRVEIAWDWNGCASFINMRARGIKRTYWSPIRLLWECLKASQYVEFEEI